jgi:polysaccharide deacetylase 2 family uncharacterized protein YibQ
MLPSRKRKKRVRHDKLRNLLFILLPLAVIGTAAVFLILHKAPPEPQREVPRPPPPAPAPPPGVGKEEIEKPKEAEKEVPVPGAPRARLALIIDDGGYNLETFGEIVRMGKPMTFAILPHAPQARRAAQMAYQGGEEVMLHLPMEPRESERYSLEMNTIRVGMSEAEILEILQDALEQVPHVRGVNNHMGSKATEDHAVMRELMKALKRKGLYFVDSHTSPHTVGPQEAHKIGVPLGNNFRFMDHENNLSAIKRSIRLAMKKAKKEGKAIAIGHPHPLTAQAIREMIPEIESEGIQLVFVSEVVG